MTNPAIVLFADPLARDLREEERVVWAVYPRFVWLLRWHGGGAFCEWWGKKQQRSVRTNNPTKSRKLLPCLCDGN